MFLRRTTCLAASLAALLSGVAAVRANDPSPEALVDGNHWKRARAVLEPRVRTNPNDAQALYLLAQVKQAYGDLDGALTLAEKAAALDGRNAAYRYLVAELYGDKADKASVFSQFGLARRFKKDAEAAIALDPKQIDARWALMEFHIQAPGIIGGDKKTAYALAQEIARINPTRGFLAQARLLRMEKKLDSPEPFYLKAVEADPKHYGARTTLAGFYLSDAQKQYDLAEKHAREAQTLDPTRSGAYTLLAQIYVKLERWQDLDAILALSDKNVPDNLNPFYQAGRVLLADGKDLPRAEKYFRKYLTQEPEPGTPTLADAHWRLGNVLEKRGRKQEAIQELQKALELNRNHEGAKKDLKRLK